MTDTFLPDDPEALLGPPPGVPAGVPAGLMPAMMPPDPAAILSALKSGAQKQQLDSGVSARDRLLIGAKIRNGTYQTPRVPETAPMPDVLAQELTGFKPGATPDMRLINVAARMEQVRANSADADRAADGWRRMAQAKDLLHPDMGGKLGRFLGGDALKEDEWSELSLAVEKTAEAVKDVADDWTVGQGKVQGIDPRPDGVFVHVTYPDTDDVDMLPDSLTGMAGASLPAHTLQKTSAGGLDVFVGPTDVTYAAMPTPENDFAIRAQFPGPIGQDGVPRWAKVAPLPITDHAAIQAGIAHQPLAVVETFPDPESYCGLHPGDYIAFDAPEKPGQVWRPPQWAAAGTYPVKAGMSRSGPKVSYAPIGAEDIPDVSTAYSRLEDTAWAVLDVEPGKLAERGLKPIEVQSSAGTKQLVFGAVPGDLEDLTDGPIYTADGIIGDDEPDADLPSWSFHVANGTVAWAAEDGSVAGGVARGDRRVRRYTYRVDPTHAKRIAQLASDFETSGASNVSVYSRQAKLEGFEPARERLYSDGVSLRVVRTADPIIGDPHAIPVHVRSTAGLPKGAVPIDPNRIVGEPIDAEGDKIVVAAEGDLAAATQQAAILGMKYGYENVVIETPTGSFKLHQPG